MSPFAGRIPCCMRCGSRQVRHQTKAEGLWAAGGEGVAWVCESCHHIGSPFLMDPDAAGAARDEALWRDELETTSFEIENEAWTRPAGATGGDRDRVLGVTFTLTGVLFLVPVVLALAPAFHEPPLWTIVRALVGTGWLLAIGLALLVVGVRRLRGSSEDGDDEGDLEATAQKEPSGAAEPTDAVGADTIAAVDGAPSKLRDSSERPSRTDHA